MKLLFYISTIRGGGAARVMVNVANGICEKGNQVFFVTNFSAEHEYELNKSIKRYVLEETESRQNVIVKNNDRIRKLRHIIKCERPNVCIAFMGENNFRLLLAAIGLKTKKIISIRNDPAKEYPTILTKVLANLFYGCADGIVFQTEDAKAVFPKRIQKKSSIIFNCVDNQFFQKENTQGEYFIACGRLSRQKNYTMMLYAFAKVLEVYPNEHLRIYGEGEQKEQLIKLTKKLNIEKSVSFMGFSTDMSRVYEKGKFLLLTSDYEGIPNVMLEALASSVPVISTDCPCGGPRMLIKNGDNGYLVPVGNDERLAEVIKDVLSNQIIEKTLRSNARKSAENFKPENVLEQWISYINQVCYDL